jgi:hypothetical protein
VELMAAGARTWRTLRLAGYEWRHEETLMRAWERESARARRRSSLTQLVATKAGESEAETREPWRLWIARPDRKRAEFRVGDGTVAVIFAGDRWWSRSPLGFHDNDGDPSARHGIGPAEALLDVNPHVADLRVISGSATEYLGRPASLISAEPKLSDEAGPSLALHLLGAGADDYELLVDDESGVLLRTEARLEGTPFRVIAVEEIAVDMPIAPETFDADRLRAGLMDL